MKRPPCGAPLLLLLLHLLGEGVAAGPEAVKKKPPPNIILMLADDLGYNDVSLHGSEIRTPAIDQLASEGVLLESFYTQYLCSPTRAALLTGRYPFRYGWHHGNTPLEGLSPVGVPLSEVFLPERLRDEAGYRTAMVGKWHLGYFRDEYLPTRRGFDSMLGFYEGWMDYWQHTSTKHRLDLHNDSAATGPACLGGLNGSYSMDLLVDEATRIIRQHHAPQQAAEGASPPLFLYVSFQSAHSPLQAPDRLVRPYAASIPDTTRRTYAGMVSALDEGVSRVMSAIRANGPAFENNTLVLFLSDNGGELMAGGNNYPLRGGKHTLFEGGMRTVGIVRSPHLLGPGNAGRVEHGLVHVTDITATLLALAGLPAHAHPPRNTSTNSTSTGGPPMHANASSSSSSLSPAAGLALDGVDQWALLSQGAASARSEILHNIDPAFGFLGAAPANSSALRVGPWKLVVGYYAACSPKDNPLFCGWKESPERGNGQASLSTYLRVRPPASSSPALPPWPQPLALFNIEADPYEMTDVSRQHPSVVGSMLERLDHFFAQVTPPATTAPAEEQLWSRAVDRAGCLAPWH